MADMGEMDTLQYDNIPRFDHIENRSNRLVALKQHRDFESELEMQHEGVLHDAVVSNKHVLRQHMAFLITKYCGKNRIGRSMLSHTITRSNGDVDQAGLFTICGDISKVNLCMLDDTTLRRVYRNITEHRRSITKTTKIQSKHCSKKTVTQDVHFGWVACDACSKWRRLPEELTVVGDWSCGMHPHGVSCDDPEDEMVDGEVSRG